MTKHFAGEVFSQINATSADFARSMQWQGIIKQGNLHKD